jgi:hypothetical protein
MASRKVAANDPLVIPAEEPVTINAADPCVADKARRDSGAAEVAIRGRANQTDAAAPAQFLEGSAREVVRQRFDVEPGSADAVHDVRLLACRDGVHDQSVQPLRVRPVIFAAPMMVVDPGRFTKSPSAVP